MPGWRSAELLRLSHDVELTLRNFARFSSRHEFGEEVGRGVGQGYFALGAGGYGFESHLVHFGGQ